MEGPQPTEAVVVKVGRQNGFDSDFLLVFQPIDQFFTGFIMGGRIKDQRFSPVNDHHSIAGHFAKILGFQITDMQKRMPIQLKNLQVFALIALLLLLAKKDGVNQNQLEKYQKKEALHRGKFEWERYPDGKNFKALFSLIHFL